MAGHIMLPSYTRAMNPDIKDDDIMPATLSKELRRTCSRGKMGFNGMVLTDASHMGGPHLPHEAQRHDPRRHCRRLRHACSSTTWTKTSPP